MKTGMSTPDLATFKHVAKVLSCIIDKLVDNDDASKSILTVQSQVAS